MHLKILGIPMPASAAGKGCSRSGCDSAERLSHLPEAIRAKVHTHPCYSEEAHHHYARMHVAVAPACNIQCHYCNRKYDCANESRPGVVSELLSPDQAVKKVMAVAAKIPQMTVLGIAGPGDPLANPERTLSTFRQISQKTPDIKLCVSTNGLALPDLADELCEHKVDHVTITINCIEPELGAKIYPWIFWKNRRIKGVKAAGILIEQQQKGLEMLVERGVLVKVNSVVIPGVNDEHLKEVAKVVKAKGAFLHNLMPLIAKAKHGTFYGLMGQREPTHDEFHALQEGWAGDMSMMRHCRQCRADAVGMLGEDRGDEFTVDKIEELEVDYERVMQDRRQVHAAIEANREARTMRSGETFISLTQIKRSAKPLPSAKPRPVLMAVATTGHGLISQHFGHAREFLIYEASATGVRLIGHRKTDRYCSGGDTCGDAETALQKTIRILEGCEVVLCTRIGYEPWVELEDAGILPNGEHAGEPIEEAVAAVYREMAADGRLDLPLPLGRQMTA
jgi:nitrogen fixation protein NifB